MDLRPELFAKRLGQQLLRFRQDFATIGTLWSVETALGRLPILLLSAIVEVLDAGRLREDGLPRAGSLASVEVCTNPDRSLQRAVLAVRQQTLTSAETQLALSSRVVRNTACGGTCLSKQRTRLTSVTHGTLGRPSHILEGEADRVLALGVYLCRCDRSQLFWPERIVVELISALLSELLLLLRGRPHHSIVL